jgi:CheY-like chemotaxis protein/two-component sensor histidine kinase
MSHELRTPLNSLLIFAKLLMDNNEGNLTPEQIESCRMIYEGGQELLSLINEILDLAKIEAGKMEFKFEKVSLPQLAQRLKHEFDPLAEKKSLEFRIDLEEDASVCITTDKKRTRQILKNLLSNAFKFTSEGQVTVKIGRPAENCDLSGLAVDRGRAIAFTISDTGIGIAKAKQKMVFSAFQQADGDIDRQFGGTGLGLSISTHLAKLLGGEIQLQSEEGRGSTFTLILPETRTAVECEDPDEVEFHTASQTALAVSESEVPCTEVQVFPDDRGELMPGDRVVLIIEDDMNFVEILMGISHEKGFKCLAESTGEAGLKSAVENQPQAIILDVGLPGMNGFNVINCLKDNSATRHIPVHFISGWDEASSSAKALSMGAIGYLTKPASREELDQVFSSIQEFISANVRKLLVAEDDFRTRQSIVKLIGNSDVDIAAVGTGQEAYDLLKAERFDCMVLDLGLPDISGFSLLEKIERDDDIIAKPPIVIYSGKDMSREEAMELRKYSGSIIVKGAGSPERLLDETSLFLHRIETSLPQEQQRMIRMAHEKETILCGKKVLIVEDDMRNIFALSHALKAKKMTVLRAENGKKALEILDANPDTDIVLMDIMMPVMDGFEAIRKIRAQEKYWKLPILALTAKAMKDDRKKCIEAGANDYLSKPVDLDKVMSMLRVWLYM